MRNSPNGRRSQVLVLAAIAILSALAFQQATSLGFLDYDDNEYVTDNPFVKPGLSWTGLRWAFTSFDVYNWHPLTWLSLQLDTSLFGANAHGFHVINLILHFLSCCLLFLWLQRATGESVGSNRDVVGASDGGQKQNNWPTGGTARAAWVALLFAVHPTVCESVLWVAERKNVLAVFFVMATLYAYVRYTEHRSRRWQLVGVVSFALGVLAKPVVVSLPALLLLLDYWPLQRRQDLRHSLLEKVPYLIGSLISGATTLIAQHNGGAMYGFDTIGLSDRVANSLIAHLRYLGHVFYPSGLIPFYPFPFGELPWWKAGGAAILLAAISAVAWRERARRPYLLLGWLWFLVALFPSNGLVQVGLQAMADRYLYLPLPGILIALVWGIADCLPGRAATALALASLGALSLQTQTLVPKWRSAETIWRYVEEVTPVNPIAQYNLATYLMKQNRIQEAKAEYERLVNVPPADNIMYRRSLGKAYLNLGGIYGALHEPLKARICFAKALQFDGNLIDIFHNMAMADEMLGDLDQERLAVLVGLSRGYVPRDAWEIGVGIRLARAGKWEEARQLFIALYDSYRRGHQSKLADRTLEVALGLFNEQGAIARDSLRDQMLSRQGQ